MFVLLHDIQMDMRRAGKKKASCDATGDTIHTVWNHSDWMNDDGYKQPYLSLELKLCLLSYPQQLLI